MRNKLLSAFIFAAIVAGSLIYSCLPLSVHTPLMKSDAIVLLAGNYSERAPAAAMLYREGYAARIILTNDGVFSSWSTKYNRNLYQIEWAEEELVALGVPRERIVKLPFYGSGTIYDALAVKRYLFKNGLNKVIVVASDFHTRRTLWTFRHVLKSYTTEIAVYPAKSFVFGAKVIVKESVKLAYYMVRYGLLGLVPVDASQKELRGVYMELTDSQGFGVYPIVADGDWRRMFCELKLLGVNAIFPNVVSPAEAVYPSTIASQRPMHALQGQPDLLKDIISAAHGEGLEVHPWTIVWHNAPKGIDPDRLMRDASGKTTNTLCPSVAANRELMRRMILELVTSYDIDGIHYDYMRFPEGGFCYCQHCREGFEKTRGSQVRNWPNDVLKDGNLEKDYQDYLYGTLNSFVREMYPLIKKVKPRLAISAAVWAREDGSRIPGVWQDWGAWVRAGCLDFLAPMNYGNQWIVRHFKDFARNEVRETAGKMPLVFGLGACMDTSEGVVRSVKLGRELGSAGFIIYTLTTHTIKEHLPALHGNVWSQPATVPDFIGLK